jgi:hypothetical protein
MFFTARDATRHNLIRRTSKRSSTPLSLRCILPFVR